MTVCCLCSQTGQSLVFVGFVQVLFDILFTGFLSCTGDAGYAQASHVRPMDESWCMWHRWCTLPKESFVSGKDNASARGNPVGGPKFGRVVFERPHVLHLVMLSGSRAADTVCVRRTLCNTTPALHCTRSRQVHYGVPGAVQCWGGWGGNQENRRSLEWQTLAQHKCAKLCHCISSWNPLFEVSFLAHIPSLRLISCNDKRQAIATPQNLWQSLQFKQRVMYQMLLQTYCSGPN